MSEDYLPELAVSLAQHATELTARWRCAEALVAGAEAVDVYETLAASAPGRFRRALAETLTLHTALRAWRDEPGDVTGQARRALHLWETVIRTDEPASAKDVLRARHLAAALELLLGYGGAAAERAADTVHEARARGRSGAADQAFAGRLLTVRALGLESERWFDEADDVVRSAVDSFEEARHGRAGESAAQLPEYALALELRARLAERSGGSVDAGEFVRRSTAVRAELGEPFDRPGSTPFDRAREILLAAVSGARRAGPTQAALEETVRLYRQLADTQTDSALPSLLGALANLGTRLHAAGRTAEAAPSLDEAVEVARRLLERDRETHEPQVSRVIVEMGDALIEHLAATDDESGLVRLIHLLQFASLPPTTDPGRARRPELALLLAQALRLRYGQRPDQVYLDQAAHALQDVVQHGRLDKPTRRVVMSELSSILTHRFETTGELGYLDAAVAIGLDEVRLGGDGPAYANAVSTTGANLRRRYERSGAVSDLETAVNLIRRALDVLPPEDPDHAGQLVNLSGVLLTKYRLTNEPGMLEEAIAAARTALRRIPPDQPQDRCAALDTLETALYLRYGRIGRMEDLDEAAELARLLVDELPPDDAGRPDAYLRLAAVLQDLHSRTGRLAELTGAVQASRAGLEGLPRDHPGRAVALSGLSTALLQRFRATGDEESLDEAVDVASEAMRLTPHGHPEMSERLAGLAQVLAARSDAFESGSDLEAATASAREALALLPEGHPDRPRHQDLLSDLLRARSDRAPEPGLRGSALAAEFERSHDPFTYQAAVREFRAAVGQASALPLDRVQAAANLGRLAMAANDPRTGLAGFSDAVQLLQLAVLSRRRGAGAVWSEGVESGSLEQLVGDAVACALAAGEPEQAVVLMEHGRVALLAHSSGPGETLAAIRERAPVVAERFELVSRRIADLDTPAGTRGWEAGRPRTEERHALAREWDELMFRIRDLPGLESFLAPPPLHALTAQASEGPLVMVNISRYRCDALVLTPSGVSVVGLPGVNEQLTERLREFRAALDPGYAPTSDRLRAEESVRSALHWLWTTIAEPVLTMLGFRSVPRSEPDRPRLWWLPTGMLGLLPLHAAQYRGAEGDTLGGGAPRSVLDCVTSSYAVTVGALASARTRRPRLSDPGLLVVSQGTGRPESEARTLVDARPHSRTRLLAGSEATRDAVRAQLPDASLLHFACHGVMTPGAPLDGGLELADGRLTTETLWRSRPDDPQLVVLSGCRTASPAQDLLGGADRGSERRWEAVSLASTLHLAGYRHVIGTLWEVQDRVYADVTELFYQGLLSGAEGFDPDRSARALHHALVVMRSRYPHIPSLWAAHVHVGP
ncbi:CHAT domain-containing protein [Streptomyces fildesensis]|uniref:CHAT domain-containing protein n=1 Tax=Streptomyces fildesensis TaxID=375757 RepID=A0ABW8C6S3_9ACTN